MVEEGGAGVVAEVEGGTSVQDLPTVSMCLLRFCVCVSILCVSTSIDVPLFETIEVKKK